MATTTASDSAKTPARAAAPPSTGSARLPVSINGGMEITGEALAALYQRSERGNGGFFPLGDSELFHCGAHIPGIGGDDIYAIADGEIVAARLGRAPGAHPWGDTGFVLLRHFVSVGGTDKTLYSLFVQTKREPLHPDNTEAAWLKRLLIAAMNEADAKPKWRVISPLPTWTDDAKGKFSPTNVQNDQLLDKGVYDQDDELILDHKHYVKLSGKWVRGSGGNGDETRIVEISPWADFDIDTASKNSPLVSDLVALKTVVFDGDKDENGKHKWKVSSGEVIGAIGNYLGGPAVHMSVFSADAVFPVGTLPDDEYGPYDPVKLASLDISSKAPGTPEHATALTLALDPKNLYFGKVDDKSVIDPDELRTFYRAPTSSWRSRYQAVKGVVDFNTDLDKLIAQDRYKSHTDEERNDFKTGAADFLFWKDLSKADDVPADGTAIFVHPITAVRLMTSVAVVPERVEPAATGGDDRLHANDDVILSVRDKNGGIAALMVTVVVDGDILKHAATDAAGEMLLAIEDVKGKDIQIEVDQNDIGNDGKLVNILNETGGPVTLQPGVPPSAQPFNAREKTAKPSLSLTMKVGDSKTPTLYSSFNEETFQLEGPLSDGLATNESLTAERFVFRRDDGKFEGVEATTAAGARIYLWSIDNGTANLDPQLPATATADTETPGVIATWSVEMAHVNDHPVFAGRVINVDDGAELEISFYGMRAIASPEHDVLITVKKATVVAGGFACDLDPAPLAQGSDLLNSARPVFARVKAKDTVVDLRGQTIMLYAAGDQLPKLPPPTVTGAANTGNLVAFFQIARAGGVDKPTTWDGKPASTKTLADIGDAHLKERIVGEGGWDQFVVGPVVTSQHIALAEQKSFAPGDALSAQKAATLAAFPDAPAWLFATGDKLYAADNGIAMGLCAQHCKDKVNAWGVASGCTEDIRKANLASCKNAHHAACQTVKPPSGKSLKVVGTCAQEPAKCGEANHDKSKCYLVSPIPGGNAEERERWHIALPLRAKDGSGNYPYQGVLRVLVINPLTGNAVVCSQEDRGPSSTSTGSMEAPEIGVAADAFKGQPHIAALSYEAVWKLDLQRSGQGDAVVMLAFVPASTPLGPVDSAKKITLRKQATNGQLLGLDPVPDQLEAPPAPGGKKADDSVQGAGSAGHVVPGPAPTPPDVEQAKPDPRKLAAIRQKIVDAAKAELGKVDDRGGAGGKRKGWQQLQKYLEQALQTTAKKEGWGQALQTPGRRAGGMRWSGAFAAYLAKAAGLKASWDATKSVINGLGAPRYDTSYLPGDILVLKGELKEHCILIEQAGDALATIAGDCAFQTVDQRTRKPAEITMYYRLSSDTFAS